VTDSPQQPASRSLDFIVGAHLAVFVIGVSWAFGGNADWVRTPISAWGSIGVLLTLAMVARKATRRRIIPGTLAWCVPILAINALVLVSCLTPGLKSLSYGSESYLMPLRVAWWTPSAARPETALRALWLFDGIYFSCLNLALGLSQRRVIRGLLALAVGNALALSIFGTIQKLMGSTGIYFGAVKSPQDYFFASFVYDNHWGAFIILMMGACVGLGLRYLQNPKGGGFFHGPAFSGLIAAFLIGISVPLSGARACSLLLGVMAMLALAKGAPAASATLQSSGISTKRIYVGIAFALILAGWGAWTLTGDVINSRASKAREQIAAAWAQGGLGSRGILYHDTWRMAKERPVFGWGMGSFPSVFAFFNSQVAGSDRIPVVYHDAHSDWLQSVAEIGFTGTALVGAAVALPLLAVRWKRMSPVPYFLAAGCVLVAAYAWVEFPFGNVAVVLAWWLCFFSAIQYIRLTDSHSVHRSR
jgi:O-antigen ligase